MIEVIVQVDIQRSADDVFAFLSEWSNNPRWQKGMRACTWTSEPPLRVGSTYDQEAAFLGRPIRSSFEVVEYEPGALVRIRSTEGSLPLDITRAVDRTGANSARVTAIVRGEPGGPARLLNPLTKRIVTRSVRNDYQRLKALLETESA